MNHPSENTEVNVETIKLLLQVAWANDTLDAAERAAVVELGPKWGIPPATLEVLIKHLDLPT